MRVRTSAQRTAVHRAVRESHDHPTAHDVYAYVQRTFPNISLATVYRNLDRLVADGKLRTVRTSGASLRYEGVLDDHGHFCCVRCGGISDLNVDLAPTTRQSLEADGFVVHAMALSIQGVCPSCL